MSSSETATMEETLEQMQARHRKEQRDLVSRITSKKKNATKKTRKCVNDECAELERQLKERHETELRSLSGGDENEQDDDTEQPHQQQQQQATDSEPAINNLAATLQTTALSSSPSPSSQHKQAQQEEQNQPKQKRTRQKERLARRAAEQEAAAAAAEAEAGSMTDHRGQERAAMQQTFGAHGLREQEIAPDGHCLFSAVADQLAVHDIDIAVVGGGGGKGGGVELGERPKVMPYRLVRRAAAEWIAGHRDEYAGFLEEGVDEYVTRIRDTAEWGGQLELSALANAYGVEIRVVQGGERIEVVSPGGEKGEGGEVKTLWLAYYRPGDG
jgi:OTU domain-containing protein 6